MKIKIAKGSVESAKEIAMMMTIVIRIYFVLDGRRLSWYQAVPAWVLREEITVSTHLT